MLDLKSDISVAIATYNGSRFLRDQLQAIAVQTMLPRQVVLFDDGSSDEEWRKTEAVLAEFPGIEIHRGANVGVRANFFRAFDCCDGDYIAPCDQDDIWTPDRLAALRNGIGDGDLSYGDLQFMSEEGYVLGQRFSAHYRSLGLDSRSPDAFRAILYNSYVWGSALLFRRGLLTEGTRIPLSTRSHDWWLAVWALSGRGMNYVDQVVTWHRVHDGNVSGNPEAKSVWQLIGETLSGTRNHDRWDTWEDWHEALSFICANGERLSKRQNAEVAEAEKFMRAMKDDTERLWRARHAFANRDLIFMSSSRPMQMALAASKLLTT